MSSGSRSRAELASGTVMWTARPFKQVLYNALSNALKLLGRSSVVSGQRRARDAKMFRIEGRGYGLSGQPIDPKKIECYSTRQVQQL